MDKPVLNRRWWHGMWNIIMCRIFDVHIGKRVREGEISFINTAGQHESVVITREICVVCGKGTEHRGAVIC